MNENIFEFLRKYELGFLKFNFEKIPNFLKFNFSYLSSSSNFSLLGSPDLLHSVLPSLLLFSGSFGGSLDHSLPPQSKKEYNSTLLNDDYFEIFYKLIYHDKI